MDPQVLRNCRAEIGTDQPTAVQFYRFIKGLVTFDFGKSMWTGRPIVEEVGLRFELSLQVAIMATITAILLAIPLGTISAVRQNTWIDYVVRAFSIAGVAVPSFWLGILLILGILIASKAWFGTPWMPPITYVPIWVDPFHNLSMLIWPALATGYRYSAVATRMTRSAVLEVLREDYVRTARAKGLGEGRVMWLHVLRNAAIPITTNVMMQIPGLLAGAFLIERFFSIPGIGREVILAVERSDFPVIKALTVYVAFATMASNLLADLMYKAVDPRVQLK